MDVAMRLYDLQHFKLLWEEEQDSKALLAWNRTTVVLAFRGTASLHNALADIQVLLDVLQTETVDLL